MDKKGQSLELGDTAKWYAIIALTVIGLLFLLFAWDWFVQQLLPVVIGLVMMITAIYLIVFTDIDWDDGAHRWIVLGLGVLGVLIFFLPQMSLGQVNMSLTPHPMSAYEYVSVSANDSIVESSEGFIDIATDLRRDVIRGDEAGALGVSVYHNGVWVYSVAGRVQGLWTAQIPVTLQPGANEFRVKFGVTSTTRDDSCGDLERKHCGEALFKMYNACYDTQYYFKKTTCEFYYNITGIGPDDDVELRVYPAYGVLTADVYEGVDWSYASSDTVKIYYADGTVPDDPPEETWWEKFIGWFDWVGELTWT